MTALEEDMTSTEGRLVQRVIDLDFAIDAGLTVTLDEIDGREFQTLRVLRSERTKYEEEQRAEQEREQRQNWGNKK